jgi:uncharacterized protein YbjT (DUF2867 family)
MKIAVAGGTGLIGRMVCDLAESSQHEVVVLARSRGIDLVTGDGLGAALGGVETVIDVTNTTTVSAKRSTAFFTAATSNLLAGERDAGVAHHVALSIVGVDRVPRGYYAGKRAQEQLLEAGSVPWTVLRATQFHEMARMAYDAAHVGPLHLAIRMRIQPVAAWEVAQRLVDLAVGPAQGYSAEIGGPREERLEQMIRAYARATGSRAWLPTVSLPGALGRAQRDGTLLAAPDCLRGVQTFTEWLEVV